MFVSFWNNCIEYLPLPSSSAVNVYSLKLSKGIFTVSDTFPFTSIFALVETDVLILLSATLFVSAERLHTETKAITIKDAILRPDRNIFILF
ncbi:hypothetical protein SDC9_201509 [bioreactor metagenome]|uniref:Uncharacterized protein n=1 Tax=bioreactor metagenome TaxID=1076179 RepID=A0A645IR51_9ZZZZ